MRPSLASSKIAGGIESTQKVLNPSYFRAPVVTIEFRRAIKLTACEQSFCTIRLLRKLLYASRVFACSPFRLHCTPSRMVRAYQTAAHDAAVLVPPWFTARGQNGFKE